MVFGGFVRLMFVPDRTGCRAAKASLHLLGARCISRAARRHSRQRCCAVVPRPMGRGALLGKVCLLGVVAVYGRSLSRWFAVSVWGSRHVCAAVCRCISAAVPLRFLDGPSVGTGPFHCQRPVAVGRARVPCSAGRGGPDDADMGRVPDFSSRWFRALGGFPHAARGRCGEP